MFEKYDFFKFKKCNDFNTKLALLSKLKLKLLSYFDQNICFYLENLKVVTLIIIYATSRTSQTKNRNV